jgi:hypothetical protein
MSDDNNTERKTGKQLSRRVFIAAAAAMTGVASTRAFAKAKITKPTIACGTETKTSIDITVCAPTGGTGLPAGFTIQWMTLEAFNAAGGVWASVETGLCDASFSGNANLSRYNLKAGECVTVTVGDFLFDNGASTNCDEPLVCGTAYVFRAFGHATSTLLRSDFTSALECDTLPCEDRDQGCTYTQGFWKTHPEKWPVDNLDLGTRNYSSTELLSILVKAPAGNGLIILAHQLIAAKLNVASGADDTAVAAAITAADALIGSLVIPPVSSGYLTPASVSSLVNTLTSYNEGSIGPGHCG